MALLYLDVALLSVLAHVLDLGRLGVCLLAMVLFVTLAYITSSTLVLDDSLLVHLHTLQLQLGDYTLTTGTTMSLLTGIATLTIVLVVTMIVCYGVYYMFYDGRLSGFLLSIGSFATYMLLIVLASDLLTIMIGWEYIGLYSYALIAFFGTRLSTTRSGSKSMLMNKLGDVLLLIAFGCLLILGSTHLTLLSLPSVSALDMRYSLSLLMIGIVITKSAQWPLHTWLLDAMEGPVPVSALIHAATLVMSGYFIYAKVLYSLDLAASSLWPLWLVFVVLGVCVVGVSSVSTKDLKRCIAYTTVIQMGYVIFIFTILGSAASWYVFAHIAYKALTFLICGVFIHTGAIIQDVRFSRAAGVSSLSLLTMLVVVACFAIGLWYTVVAAWKDAMFLGFTAPIAGWSWDIIAFLVIHVLLNIVWAVSLLARYYTSLNQGRSVKYDK